MSPDLLPAPDAIPLPGPVWLVHELLLLTFLLHVVPMTVTLGGGLWAVLAARRARQPAFAALARRMAAWLPYWIAAAVSTGVAALLFLQALYGPAFYAASAIQAWPWLSIVGLVLAGYYATYYRAARLERSPRAAAAAGLAAWLAFVLVSAVQVSEMTFMLRPDLHREAWLASGGGGAVLFLGDLQLLPRWLHMVVGAVAVAGLWVAALGGLAARRGEPGAGEVAAFGFRGFALATGGEALLGLLFLAVQPVRVLALFAGGGGVATGALVLALLLTGSAVWIAWRAADAGGEGAVRRAAGAAAHVVVILALMVVMRDELRRAALGAAARLDSLATAPQWALVGLFAALLAAALATIGWMVQAVRTGRPDPEDAAGAPADARPR